MYISILLIGLVLTLGAVSAGENITETSTVSAYETPTETTNFDNAEEAYNLAISFNNNSRKKFNRI